MGVLLRVTQERSDGDDYLAKMRLRSGPYPTAVIRGAAMAQGLASAGVIPHKLVGSVRRPLKRVDEDALRRATVEKEEYGREREGFISSKITGHVIVRVRNSKAADDQIEVMDRERQDWINPK